MHIFVMHIFVVHIFILHIFAGNQFYIVRVYIFVDFVFNGLGRTWSGFGGTGHCGRPMFRITREALNLSTNVKGFDGRDPIQRDFGRLFKEVFENWKVEFWRNPFTILSRIRILKFWIGYLQNFSYIFYRLSYQDFGVWFVDRPGLVWLGFIFSIRFFRFEWRRWFSEAFWWPSTPRRFSSLIVVTKSAFNRFRRTFDNITIAIGWR